MHIIWEETKVSVLQTQMHRICLWLCLYLKPGTHEKRREERVSTYTCVSVESMGCGWCRQSLHIISEWNGRHCPCPFAFLSLYSLSSLSPCIYVCVRVCIYLSDSALMVVVWHTVGVVMLMTATTSLVQWTVEVKNPPCAKAKFQGVLCSVSILSVCYFKWSLFNSCI